MNQLRNQGVRQVSNRKGAKPVRLTRRKKAMGLQLASAVAVIVAGISIVGAAPSQSSEYGGLPSETRAYPVVVVQAGDSLWAVAERVSAGEDPRVVVERIKDLNELTSSVLQPGKTLRVE